MGGLGSGRTAGFGFSVDKCHELHSIDLAWLQRKNLLIVGRTATLTWSRAGQAIGSIGIERVGTRAFST